MYGTMKYVRFVDMNGIDSMIMFSNHMNHRDTIKCIRHIEVISAGFVVKSGDGYECTGRSVSLNIDSIPEQDTPMLQNIMRGL